MNYNMNKCETLFWSIYLNRKYLSTLKLSDVSQYVTVDGWMFPFCLSHSHSSTSLPTNLVKRLLDGYWFDLIYYQREINKQYFLIFSSMISAKKKKKSVSGPKDHVLWLLHKSRTRAQLLCTTWCFMTKVTYAGETVYGLLCSFPVNVTSLTWQI